MNRVLAWLAQPKVTALFAAGIILLAFALRVHRLGDANLWLDEASSVWLSKGDPIPRSLTRAPGSHPPLYFLILHWWRGIAGESEFALRFPSAFFGTMSIASLFFLGKRLGGAAAGIGGALFLAASRFAVEWSQEIRMYSLAGFLVLISLILFLKFLESNSWKHGLGWVLFSTAGLYTLYLSGLVLVIENLTLLFFLPSLPNPRRRFLLLWLSLQLLVIALFSPWLFLSAETVRIGSGEPANWLSTIRLWGSLLAMGISTNTQRFDLINGILALILLGGAFLARPSLTSHRPEEKKHYWPLLLLSFFLLLPPFFLFLVSHMNVFVGTPRLEARYFLPFLAPVYLLLAISLLSIARRLPLLGLSALISLITIFGLSLYDYYDSRILKDDLQSMMLTLRAHRMAEDGVVVISGRMPVFLYYFDRDLGPDRYKNFHALPQASPFSRRDIKQGLLPFTSTYSRLWLVQDQRHLLDPDGLAQTWLNNHARIILDLPFAHNRLTLYATREDASLLSIAFFHPQHYLRAGLTPGISLVGYDLPVQEFAPGDFLHLGLYFVAERPGTVWLVWQDAAGKTISKKEIQVSPTSDNTLRISLEVELLADPVSGPSALILVGEGIEEMPLVLDQVTINIPERFFGP